MASEKEAIPYRKRIAMGEKLNGQSMGAGGKSPPKKEPPKKKTRA